MLRRWRDAITISTWDCERHLWVWGCWCFVFFKHVRRPRFRPPRQSDPFKDTLDELTRTRGKR